MIVLGQDSICLLVLNFVMVYYGKQNKKRICKINNRLEMFKSFRDFLCLCLYMNLSVEQTSSPHGRAVKSAVS